MISANAAHADAARCGGRQLLAAALSDTRARTLALLDAYAAALGGSLTIPYSPQLNPPCWEAGHIGWFQDYWIARNQQRPLGIACDPTHERAIFFRLVLFHEDMHGEAGIYMAQAQDVRLPESLIAPARAIPEVRALAFPAGKWPLGWSGGGFAFDNELAAQEVLVPAYHVRFAAAPRTSRAHRFPLPFSAGVEYSAPLASR